jgi:hypothetical protein
MGAMFFSSITASAFSQADTTAGNVGTNTTTPGTNNSTLYSDANTTTAGANGDWSNYTSSSDPVSNQSQ